MLGSALHANFDEMRSSTGASGYPFVLVLILLICLLFYRRFKRVGWL